MNASMVEVRAEHAVDLYALGVQARARYWRESLLLLPSVPLFYSRETYNEIGQLCSTALQYERIDSGDTNDNHDLNCARLMKSPANHKPTIINDYAQPILSRLGNANLMRYVQGVLGIDNTPLYFRRAQSHEMGVGQYIGPHVDDHADPDWDCVVILYLESDFTGGVHMMDYRDGRPVRPVPVHAGEIFIGPVDVWHWVTPVETGRRRSLIGFLSRYDGANRRSEMDPPRYGE